MNYNATASNARDFIKKHSLSKIVDIGCGKRGLFGDIATTFLDYQDYSSIYTNGRFVVHDISTNPTLPFKDKEFEFSLCSHVLEHLDDPRHFLFEIQRVSSAGYIETPLPLADNLLSIDGDPYGHKWWIESCYKSQLIIRKRERVIEHNLDMDSYISLLPSFASSFNVGFLWQSEIDFAFMDPDAIPVQDSKLTRLALKTVNKVENSGLTTLLRSMIRK